MTDTDKVPLRQYEGAGRLGEADASTTLYKFYTPATWLKGVGIG